MSIDPNLMKQLLQLHFQGRFDLTPFGSKSSSSQSQSDLDFSSLLETMMGQASIPDKSVQKASFFPTMMRGRQHFVNDHTTKPAAFEPLIDRASSRYSVDPSLVKAVIHTESSFNPNAVSTAGAKGLMQLMDETGKVLGVSDPFDPEQNIDGGTKFLRDLLHKYNGNEAVALAAYNAGPGRVDRLGITNDIELRAKFSQLPQETQNYINKVLEMRRSYQS